MWYGYGMGVWGWVMMVVFWAAVIALVVWAVRSTSGTVRPDPDQALRVLDERFARGDIDHEDYEERRRVLQSHR